MIVLGVIIGIAFSVGLGVLMLRFSRKCIRNGQLIAWPLWTYLWGVLITLPLALIMLTLSNSSQSPNSGEWELALQISAGLPLFVLHMGFGIAFSILWGLNIFDPNLRNQRSSKS